MAGIDSITGKVPEDPAAQVDLALDGCRLSQKPLASNSAMWFLLIPI